MSTNAFEDKEYCWQVIHHMEIWSIQFDKRRFLSNYSCIHNTGGIQRILILKNSGNVCAYIYIYIYIYMKKNLHFFKSIYMCGAFNKVPDFFVQAFKIVIDSRTFSILLLYISWDDWLIFMISGSNEQLQQQLEYTLLKPDCHCWWVSKRKCGHLKERYAIKFCFKLGKNATESYGMLQTAFRLSCMNRASVFEWHKRFKEGREFVRDDGRCGRSKEVNTPELIGQRVRVRVTMLRF